MKDIAEMNYSEFCEYLEGEGYDSFEQIYGEEAFSIYLHKQTHRYFYLEGGINDASEFYELILLAHMNYQVNCDMSNADKMINYTCQPDFYIKRRVHNYYEHYWFNKKKQKMQLNKMTSTYKAIKLPWNVAAYYIENMIEEIIGYHISCRIAVDSYDYWGIVFTSYRMPTPELLKLLGALGIDGKTCKEELPNDEEGVKDTGDLSVKVSEILLKRAVPFEYDRYFFDVDDVWLLKCEDAEDKTDNLS